MSSSDARLWADMVARVERLEATVDRLVKEVEGEDVSARDMTTELYGAPADHTEDRAERAELRRGPGRPPGPRGG